MPTITEVVHERGLDFENQRKVVLLRDSPSATGKKLSFAKIAARVRNLQGSKSTEDVVRRVYKRFNRKKGRVSYKYHRCGRKPWKVTKDVGNFLVQRLLQKRKSTLVTSTTLQAELYKEKKVNITCRAVRKHLFSKGYRWLPRSQKRKYDRAAKMKRRAFAAKYKDRSQSALSEHIACAMDGVIITVPPLDDLGRLNFCLHGETHMYRKVGEAALPELSGDDPYGGQVPLSRAIPMWGAISAAGFQEILWHKTKKLNKADWVKAVKAGKLYNAVKKLQPGRHVGPRRVICDNESFLEGKECRGEYKKKRIQLLHIPAKSPDFNPIESFWGWLRKELRRLDLEDYRSRRPALGKTAYRQRVRNVLRTKKAQDVAKAKWSNFKKVCREVYSKKGAASRT